METYWVLRNGSIECRVAPSTPKAAVAAAAVAPVPQPHRVGQVLPKALRLTRRGRALLAGLSLAITAPLLGAGAVAAASSPPVTSHYVSYTVAAGESLWTIAERFKVAGTDTRDEVYHIQRINHMATSTLYAGQVILVDSAS